MRAKYEAIRWSRKRWPTAVDLFCGSGAVTEALKRRHFKVVAAIDNDPVACDTFRANHPLTHMIERDIRKIDPAEIRRRDLKGRNVDLLVVCAPCQPFSNQNRKRGADSRSRLILEAGRFARVLRPRLIFFENVPGLASQRYTKLRKELQQLLGADYVLGEPQRVDAADYGVPQRRVRCIMLAARHGEPPRLPLATTPQNERVTVRAAIGRLKKLRAGETDRNDSLHAARCHSQIALLRLAAIPKNGGSRRSLPRKLQLPCHRRLKARDFPDVYGRIAWNDVAPTLTTGCTDVTRGRFGHPDEDRAISLREAALLQTFPRDYHFRGTSRQIQTQIGNAVPVKLIDAFAATLRAGIAGERP
jgi:DNA (cytosine-5)-methyltransferase 1